MESVFPHCWVCFDVSAYCAGSVEVCVESIVCWDCIVVFWELNSQAFAFSILKL